MRIRKRFQNPFPSPDLSSPLPSSGLAVVAAVAPPVAAERGAAGVKAGEAIVAAAAFMSGGDRCGGGGGKGGFHPNGHAASPTPRRPFQLPSGAAAAEGEEGGVPPKPGLRLPTERDALFDCGDDKEVAVPKREADQEGKEIGDAPTSWDMDAFSRNGANSIASRSLGAEPSEGSSGPGHTVPLMAEQAVPRWRKEEGEFPLMKTRPGHHARGRSLGLEEEEEEDVVAERDVKAMPSMTRRRRAAAFSTKSTMAATGTGAGATKRGDDVSVKEEGANVMPAVAAASAEGNVGVGNGKKRRSPAAVLMEGSRCSRVNGRGWRCCQQTLVGYSLCEHHLGKGRLRSVSSVRSNCRASKEDVGDHPGNKRRRNNVGMVKARSLSSLLHQPDHRHPSPTVAIAAPPEPIPSPSPTPAARPATAAAPPPRATNTVVA